MPKRDYHTSKFATERGRQAAIKKEKKSFLKMIGYFFILIIIFGAIYFFLFSDVFKIKKIIITGTDRVEEINTIESIINGFIEHNRFLIFSQKNSIVLNESSLKNAIKNNFDFEDIQVKIEMPDTLMVEVKIKTPKLIWQAGDKFFTIYSDGRIKNQVNQGEFELPIINRGTSTAVNIGDLVATDEQINYIQQLFSLFKFYFKDLEVTQFVVTSFESREVRLITSENWYILFNLDLDPEESIITIKAVLNQKIEDRTNLQYIDARIKDRVYYK